MANLKFITQLVSCVDFVCRVLKLLQHTTHQCITPSRRVLLDQTVPRRGVKKIPPLHFICPPTGGISGHSRASFKGHHIGGAVREVQRVHFLHKSDLSTDIGDEICFFQVKSMQIFRSLLLIKMPKNFQEPAGMN